MSDKQSAAATIPIAVILAGCAGAPPAAIVNYAHTDCSANPSLSTPISLIPPKEKAVYTVTTPLDATAPCLNQHGAALPYQIYALPETAESKTIMAGSILEEARLVPPEISILDRQGRVTRRFSPADFFFRGAVYSVQFRPRVAEAYVLVAADSARVGQRYDAIAIGLSTTSSYSNGAAISWTRGLDQRVSRTFSYEGSITVSIYDEMAVKER